MFFSKIYKSWEGIQEEKYKVILKNIDSNIFDKIVKCPYVPGALEFLKHYHGVIPLYLVSVSPEKELDRILKERNIKHYFKDVYSSEWKKTDAIKDIIHKEQALSDKTVFIGDTDEDYLAAEEAGIIFIGRNSGKQFFDANITLFDDFDKILNQMQ